MSTGDLNVSLDNTDEMPESEISQEVKDLSDNLDQLLAETPQNQCKSQTDNTGGKGKPHKTTEQDDDLLAEITGEFTQDTDASTEINSKLADIVNNSVSEKLAGEKVSVT